MMEWLLAPIDPSRVHEVSGLISWHARVMVLAWGILAPLAVLIARFFKVLPGQDWPRELDSQVWWRSHWMGQGLVVCLTALGLGLVLSAAGAGAGVHGLMGYTVAGFAAVQVALGMMRGSKGGPTAPARDGSLRGDHYDMTRWRLFFEVAHKSLGYVVLGLAVATILQGLWGANGPRWMWLALAGWWSGVGLIFVILQRRGWAVDTYQAIWGDDPVHPGNLRPRVGWGMRRKSADRRLEQAEHAPKA